MQFYQSVPILFLIPLVEGNSVIWSLCLKQNTDILEGVLVCFTKRLVAT